jgi:hypothetical protein
VCVCTVVGVGAGIGTVSAAAGSKTVDSFKELKDKFKLRCIVRYQDKVTREVE